MDRFREFDDAGGTRLTSAIGIANGVVISIVLWLGLVDAWLLWH